MSRRYLAVAALLVLAAASLIAYKVLRLGYELAPGPAPDRWSVQTEVQLGRTADRARVAFFLPADGPSQRIYDERVTAEGMRFFIRPQGSNRLGVALGGSSAGSAVTYRFSVQTREGTAQPIPATAGELPPEEAQAQSTYLASEGAIQSDSEVVTKLLDELSLRGLDRAAALRQIHEFVHQDVATTDGHDGPQDAVAVLERERGGAQGKARAEVALLRAAHIPARMVIGVPMEEGSDRELHYWVEARLGNHWFPLDPVHGAMGSLPEPRLTLHVGDAPSLEASGVDSVAYHVSMLREPQNQWQIYQRRVEKSDKLLDRLSLYSLPVKTQVLYRVLMLVPLGALVVAVFRNLIGVPTFGTFMPILISLAFRDSGIGVGFALLAVVVAVGYGGRWALDRANLLMVPRLSFLLTLVILIIAGIMLVADQLGSDRAFSMALFPVVIVTMTIERLSIAIVEEGPRNAFKLVLGTAVVATCGYLVIASSPLQHFVFTFPEVHLVTLAILLVIGRYTGYRLSEWARFRAFRGTGS